MVELTAARELAEETGYEAQKLWRKLRRFFTSPGLVNRGDRPVSRRADSSRVGHGFDRDEILDVVEFEPESIPVLHEGWPDRRRENDHWTSHGASLTIHKGTYRLEPRPLGAYVRTFWYHRT